MTGSNVKQSTRKPLIVLCSYVFLNTVIYSLGGFLLADGWSYIDSSWCRDFLYAIFFWVWPPIIFLSIIHFLSIIINKEIALTSLKISFCFGFAGPLLLHILISTSRDPVAGMAYIVMGIYYFIFALAGFIISCITIWIYKVLTPRLRGGN